MRKKKRSSLKIKNKVKKGLDLRLVLVAISIFLIAAILVWGNLQKTVFAPKAALRKTKKTVKKNNFLTPAANPGRNNDERCYYKFISDSHYKKYPKYPQYDGLGNGQIYFSNDCRKSVYVSGLDDRPGDCCVSYSFMLSANDQKSGITSANNQSITACKPSSDAHYGNDPSGVKTDLWDYNKDGKTDYWDKGVCDNLIWNSADDDYFVVKNSNELYWDRPDR